MGADTPAAGGDTKPVVKHEGRSPYHGVATMQTKITTTIIIPGRNSLERTQTFAEKYSKPSTVDQNRLPISKPSTT